MFGSICIENKSFAGEQALIVKSDMRIIAVLHKRHKNLSMRNKKIVDIWNVLNNGGKI